MLTLKALRIDDDGGISTYTSRTELMAEACHDLAKRSITGVFAYLIAWSIIYLTSDLEPPDDRLLEFLGFMLVASGVGRLYLAVRFRAMYYADALRWRRLFAVGTVASAAAWGVVCALTLDYDGLDPTSLMVMLSTAGIAAGGIVSLEPAPRLGGVFVLLLLLPVVPFALAAGSTSERGVALLFMIFFIFMFVMWRRLRLEYWSALAGRAELVRAKEAAEAANEAQGQFIANVSHELRTPLTAIVGALGLIESDLPDSASPQTMKLVDMAYQNAIHLSSLINDILDFEKLSAGHMTFNLRPVALAPCLRRALELNRSYAARYDVSFALEPPPEDIQVIADTQRLLQVMVISCPMRPSIRPPEEPYRFPSSHTRPPCASRSVTKAQACLTHSGRTSSRNSLRPKVLSPAGITARAWAWPSASRSSKTCAARSDTNPRQDTARRSSSTCRARAPSQWQRNTATDGTPVFLRLPYTGGNVPAEWSNLCFLVSPTSTYPSPT